MQLTARTYIFKGLLEHFSTESYCKYTNEKEDEKTKRVAFAAQANDVSNVHMKYFEFMPILEHECA